MKCDELKSYTIYEGDVGNYTEHVVYSKSEADAYIRKLKYKRCLSMAEWCEATALWSYQAANTLPVGFHATLHGKTVMIEPKRLFNRSALLTKWNTHWLELAEKFKEAK